MVRERHVSSSALLGAAKRPDGKVDGKKTIYLAIGEGEGARTCAPSPVTLSLRAERGIYFYTGAHFQ